jgi:hypothetical protein
VRGWSSEGRLMDPSIGGEHRIGVWEVLSVYTFCVGLICYFDDIISGKKPSLISPMTGEAPMITLLRTICRELYRLYSQVRYIEEAIGVSCDCVKRRTHTCPALMVPLPCNAQAIKRQQYNLTQPPKTPSQCFRNRKE